MSFEYDDNGTRIEVNTDLFYPSQTILGFTLEALNKRILQDTRISGKELFFSDGNKRLSEGIGFARHQAALRIMEIAPSTAARAGSDEGRARANIVAIEAGMYQLPETLAKVVEGVGRIWVKLTDESAAEIKFAAQDVELMRASGMYVQSSIQTVANNPDF